MNYSLFVLLPNKRALVAVGAGLLLIITRTVTLKEAFLAINWNAMGIFIGTLIKLVTDTNY
jgi:hypothetical protein